MFKSSTLAAAATLALAAVPMLALATNASATEPVAVKVSDINTLTPEGARAFADRVDAAANRFCQKANPNMRLTERASCEAAVKVEVAEKLQAHNTMLAAKAGATVASR